MVSSESESDVLNRTQTWKYQKYNLYILINYGELVLFHGSYSTEKCVLVTGMQVFGLDLFKDVNFISVRIQSLLLKKGKM